MPACEPTHGHVEGPFYRPGAPELTDLYPQDSKGPVLWFSGSVLNSRCQPIAGALLDIWQADDKGRYDNDDPTKPPPATFFRCRGKLLTDEIGRFLLRTVLPANYPVPGESWVRVKHIHFKIYAPGFQPLTTEIELLPDAYTKSDQLYDPALAVTLEGVATPVHGAQEYRVHVDFVIRTISAAGYALAAATLLRNRSLPTADTNDLPTD